MMFYAAFNSISVISRRQFTLFMLSWVSPVLGWALKCLAQGHSHDVRCEYSAAAHAPPQIVPNSKDMRAVTNVLSQE